MAWLSDGTPNAAKDIMQIPPLFALLPGRKHALIYVVGQHERERRRQMKVTRMTVEGGKGWANIARRDGMIHAHGDGAAGLFDLRARPDIAAQQVQMARQLQYMLDGYRGAVGDVAECLRFIQTFAD
jgi:hypothetical protein